MIIKVAIADKNKEYLERLVVGLEKYSDISLAVYSDEESLERAFQERKYDVFLFDPDVYMQSAAYFHTRADLKILLDDKEKVIADVYADAKRVDKYQRVSRIYKKILELYSEVCGREIAQEDGYTSVVAYYSPVGGAGKTTLALVSAAKSALLGKRTFYISFEDIASEDCYLHQGDDEGLSELMCHIERNTNLSFLIVFVFNGYTVQGSKQCCQTLLAINNKVIWPPIHFIIFTNITCIFIIVRRCPKHNIADWITFHH